MTGPQVTVTSIVLADDTTFGAGPYGEDGRIWVQAGNVQLYLSDDLAAQLVGAVEQARREAGQKRGDR